MTCPNRHDMRQSSAFTAEIIQNSLQAIAAEMFDAMRLTAMSPVIYEVLDLGTGILNAKGELASSGAGIPVLVGVVDKAVRRIVAMHPNPGEIEEGDVFITNDPAFGGVTHLNDIALAMPVFDDGQLIAWTANSAHWNDVGGMVPGSMGIHATEIYHEGLRIPAVKLISRGVTIRSVVDIIKANSRTPDFSEGDMWAGVASVRAGERRLKEVVAKYGRAAFLSALEDSMDLAERVSLRALAKLPKGRFTLEEPQDDGVTYRVTIDVTETEMVVDMRDNPDSVKGPGNTSRDATEIAAQIAFKAMTEPTSTSNGGTFRPLKVLTRPGSVFDAQIPTAQGFYFETLIRGHDLVLQCLARESPKLACAGTFSSIALVFVSGYHPDIGRHFNLVGPELGGWGASWNADGNNAMFSGIHGDTFNCPVEISETRYGIHVKRFGLNPTAAGAGQFNGGRGIVLEYSPRADGALLTVGFSRAVVPPWSLEGGNEGSPNYVQVVDEEGNSKRYAFDSNIPVGSAETIRVVTGNGAGFGDPKLRDLEAIKRDMRDGYIGPAQAREIYPQYA